MSIRIVMADDEGLTRAGLSALLAGTEIEVVAEATNCEQVVRQTVRSKPDVVLLDIRMQGENGFDALQQIRKQCPDTSILMFSVCDSLAEIARAYTLGADGYVCKSVHREELLQTIRKAATGRDAWTRQQRRRVSSGLLARESIDAAAALTPRETEVLRKLTEGKTNDEISEELAVDVETIKHHVKHILAKLGVEDRTQAALWAVRHGVA